MIYTSKKTAAVSPILPKSDLHNTNFHLLDLCPQVEITEMVHTGHSDLEPFW